MAGLSIVLSYKAVRRESFHELLLMVPQLPADEKPASRSGFRRRHRAWSRRLGRFYDL